MSPTIRPSHEAAEVEIEVAEGRVVDQRLVAPLQGRAYPLLFDVGVPVGSGGDGADLGSFASASTPTRRGPTGLQSFARRSSCALIATITVLSDISTAPTAGESRMPARANTPAARGMAMML